MPRGIYKHKKGYHLSEEWKRKIGEGNRDKIVSEESRIKISRANKGKKKLEEHKRKMSEAKKGKIYPHKPNCQCCVCKVKRGERSGENHPLYGTHRSKKTRRKISEAHLKNPVRYWLGKKRPPLSEETKRKISEGNKGKIVSEESKKKMSGENHWNWLDGISFEPYGIEFNDELREKIRKREKSFFTKC